MRELDKILEEIDEEIRASIPFSERRADGLRKAKDIIRKHIKNEDDILKFYYCESEDDYYLGQRIQNMYYARYEPGGFTWFMSRYLPWGEGDYPSEPKEIPFIEWIEGFIRKHTDVPANDGWIPADDPPEDGQTVLCTDGDYVYLVEYDADLDAPFGDMDGITFWQPSPEPYRPERS